MRKALLIIAALVVILLGVYYLQPQDDQQPEQVAELPGIVVPPPLRVESTVVKNSTGADTVATISRFHKPRTVPVPPPGSTPSEPAAGDDQDGASILKRAGAAYASIRSMQADFAQWQENPLLGRRTSSRGKVYQRRPDRFLMRFSQPDGDVIVSDGEYFWVYYPSVDQKQVIRTKTGTAGGLDLRAQFIGDPTTRFRHTLHGTEQVNGRAARVLTLVPREDAGYKTLKVWIDQQDYLVRRFELTNENDVVQHFDLTNLQINPTLSDALFRFTPPAGARIIDR